MEIPEVEEEANTVVAAAAAGGLNDSPKEAEQTSVELVGIPAVESLLAPERKTSTEDPSAIIESLRARLLSERNSSKSARQQAQHLSRRVKELEKGLEAEVQRRKQCESLIQELITKLDKAGVNVDTPTESFEEQEQISSRKLKPSWISISRTRSSSDSLEGDGTNNNGDQESTSPHSPAGSPVSDTSFVSRRVGRSCRTVRRKELWDVGIDELVKGNWGRVGADIVEISKLRESEALGSESGWLSRMVDMYESKAGGSCRAESSVDTEVGSSNNNVEENSYENTVQSDASTSIPENRNCQTNVASDSNIETACVSHSSTESSAVAVAVPESDGSARELERESQRMHEQADTRDPVTEARQHSPSSKDENDVKDILRALRLAKQQLRNSTGNYNTGDFSPAHRSFTDFQPRYENGGSNGLVTRPLAQFIPASHEFRIQRSRSHHSYVDTRLSFANFSSPGRF